MQRLEASCAVRRIYIYMSLGAKVLKIHTTIGGRLVWGTGTIWNKIEILGEKRKTAPVLLRPPHTVSHTDFHANVIQKLFQTHRKHKVFTATSNQLMIGK